MGEILPSYELNRDQMKTGDLLLWRSNSLLGVIIRRFSKGIVNHASLLVRLSEYEGIERRVFTSEALEHGIVLNLLSKRMKEYDGDIWWYQLKPEWNVERTKIGERAFEYMGTPYDYDSLFKNAICKVSAEATKLFCSEYYYICLGQKGKAPTPQDLISFGWFNKPVLIYTSNTTGKSNDDPKKWGG